MQDRIPKCGIIQYRRLALLLVLLSCLFLSAPHLVFKASFNDLRPYALLKYSFNGTKNSDETLVWDSKCHILARNPLDSSILKFVKTEKLEKCTERPLLTKVILSTNDSSSILIIDAKAAKAYPEVSCCWATIQRPIVTKNPPLDIDSGIKVDACTPFLNEVILPRDTEAVLVKCKTKTAKGKKNYKKSKDEYSNIHPVIALSKIEENTYRKNMSTDKKELSILVLGIDTVSRLDFKRTMPKTWKRLIETGWIEMQGYNKMGENTFPNLMAILTGLNSPQAYSKCSPTRTYGLDKCPLMWYAFRNANYVTAYGEDVTIISTFNYHKTGFVNPPTNYYLRPYLIATEKILGKQERAGNSEYCTGPELVMERIFNYAENFAKIFIGTPYFGFFWTNSLTHEDINGLSAVDGRVLSMFERLESEGVLNDTMVIFLSDHGARYGPIRETVQGWYEDRLPFLYVWLPEWFRTQETEALDAMRANANRLMSPFDLYETLRDVLIRAGGNAAPSLACPRCQSILRPITTDRGCDDVGISPHWCACTAFEPANIHDAMVTRGAQAFVEHVNNVVKEYKSAKGKRLCATLKLKRIIRVEENMSVPNRTDASSDRVLLYLLQLTPGDGKFEVSIRHKGDGNFTISEAEVSRINVYGNSAKCLTSGNVYYCHCV